jgi:V-type H+-transporting ATPase subunit H
VQGQYELVVCVWLLSLFQPGNDVLSTPELVKALVDYVRLAHKEKVIRASLLALKSLLRESGKVALELSAVESGLDRALENRLNQAWDDPDIVSLLEWLQDRLDAGVMAMSSLERYRKEITQGVLVPGPMHDSEAFWLENAERLMDNNSALIKSLLELLDPSHDATTLRLACRGVSNFITYYPHGKGVVSDLGGKTLVMRLMAHPDAAVQREALLCIQRLLLSRGNLSYLSL